MRKILLMLFVFCGLAFNIEAQQKIISGTVTSSIPGEGVMIGVSVSVKGTTTGINTDLAGKYTLAVPESATTLVFSYIGMKKQEVEIGNRSVIDVVLEPDIQGLDEVVVTALGVSREKKAVGYSVQDVKNEVIKRTGNTDLAGAMQGKISGIDIKPSSGMPGASSQIVIRGARSFTGNNTPLYVVDGMPISSTADIQSGTGGNFTQVGAGVTGSDISNRAVDLNPADIESVNVLKGQAAAALYGIRASNGVIVITTKSGRNNALGKPVVSISHTSAFSKVSRTPDYQTTYAQGTNGVYVPNSSLSWGPKIVDLPDDPVNGGNANGHPGEFYVPQLATGQVEDTWVTPQVFNNWDRYFRTGYSATNNVSITQAMESGNFALGLTQTKQSGVALASGMDRWNGKASAERKMGKNFSTGFNANFSKTDIDKLPTANDAALAGVLGAPVSYNLKDYPYYVPGDVYTQIYYRGGSWDNPYWAAEHTVFNEKTDRFFGNGYINFNSALGEKMMLKIRYQIGADTYTTNFKDVFEYGHAGTTGMIDNYGITSFTVNSLLTANLDWNLSNNLTLNALVGNEFDHNSTKTYSEHGEEFNFGGWAHIRNANIVTADELQNQNRTVGTFGSLSLQYRSILFLTGTGRYDRVSTMPTNNRSFFYPSVALSFVASEIDAMKSLRWISFAKVRLSYAEVGQAGAYTPNYFGTPFYGSGWWTGSPIQYPIGGINSYIPNNVQFDPNLVPQNTRSYEAGAELKFFQNRLGIDYSYSYQNVVDQIFSVPLAGSTGITSLLMNGGKVHTVSHEAVLYVTPLSTKSFQWDLNFNFSKIDNYVDELAEGVESIFIGGFTTPQVRAGIGDTYPVIYGDSFMRNEEGKIVVEDNPASPNYGFPLQGEPDVIGEVSPDFILGGGTNLSYKNWSLNALFEWKQGGEMYSGSNGLLDYYGLSTRVEDRESTFIFDGVKRDGTPNDIVRGGPNDPLALQLLHTNVLTNIDEYYIFDNSFVKLREVSLKYQPAKKLFNKANLGLSVFMRNVLLWTALPNLDPESSQGNTNMGGSFERFTVPQTTTFGFNLDLTF
ncbi:MAG: SusC/RagA family TonB-linked outer membrane protein [Bacteroidales bacterium]|jgi:TonB-linked SusC/RagA family outer membrane protein|nr:SusC/RagA family TonB-linked outer membrane protein [Bacteroidales bacterium]